MSSLYITCLRLDGPDVFPARPGQMIEISQDPFKFSSTAYTLLRPVYWTSM